MNATVDVGQNTKELLQQYDAMAETRTWINSTPRNEIADEVLEMISYRTMLEERYEQLKEELIRIRSVIQQDDVDRVADVQHINTALHEEGWPDLNTRLKNRKGQKSVESDFMAPNDVEEGK